MSNVKFKLNFSAKRSIHVSDHTVQQLLALNTDAIQSQQLGMVVYVPTPPPPQCIFESSFNPVIEHAFDVNFNFNVPHKKSAPASTSNHVKWGWGVANK